MPTFDRASAKAAGYTDAEIDSFLASPAGTPGTTQSRVDPFGVGGGQEAPIQYSPMGGRAYSGTPDQPLQENLLNQIQTGLEIGTAPFAAADLARLGGRGLLAAARAPIIRRFPGTAFVRNVGSDIEGLLGRARGLQSSLEPAAAEAEAASAMRPLVGAEGAAYTQGGMPAVEAMRAAAPAEATAAPIAGTVESRIAQAGHMLNHEEAKVVLDASRRRGFATLKEAGIQGEKAINAFIKKVIGRKFASKTELNVSDWLKVNKAADEAVLEGKAAVQAAARAGKATVKAVVPKAKPVAGTVASRVGATPEVPPGTLQRLAQMNLTPQELYDFWRQAQ